MHPANTQVSLGIRLDWSECSLMVLFRAILAHGIRISEILSWDRKSYLTHAILLGRQVTSSCEIAF